MYNNYRRTGRGSVTTTTIQPHEAVDLCLDDHGRPERCGRPCLLTCHGQPASGNTGTETSIGGKARLCVGWRRVLITRTVRRGLGDDIHPESVYIIREPPNLGANNRGHIAERLLLLHLDAPLHRCP